MTSYLYEGFFQIPVALYHKIQNLINNEENSSVKVNKRMMIFITLNMICLVFMLPVMSPRVHFVEMLIPVVMNIAQFVFVLLNKPLLFMSFHVFIVTSTLYGFSFEKQDALRAMGVVFMQHNYTYILPRSYWLKLICMMITFILNKSIQDGLYMAIQEDNIEVMKEAITNFQCEWPLVYMFNLICATKVVDEHYKASQETKEANAHLRRANQQLTDTNKKLETTLSLLEKTNKNLNEAVKSRELFIAGMSHELRNPLNALLGNIDLLSMDIVNSKHSTMLETCKQCCGILLGLINNVLDVAKINAERVELNVQNIDLHQLVEQIWNISTAGIKQKRLKGFLHLSKTLPRCVKADLHRLNQILLNLIGNATKFTSKGEVKVLITWHNSKTLESKRLKFPSEHYTKLAKLRGQQSFFTVQSPLTAYRDCIYTLSDDTMNADEENVLIDQTIMSRTIQANTMTDLELRNCLVFTDNDNKILSLMPSSPIPRRDEDGILRIEIIDTGCGINSCTMQHLFKPFSQADHTVTRKYGGTGLGLYITKQIIEKMGGQIDIHSQEAIGSSFCVLLPLKSATSSSTVLKCQDDTPREMSQITSMKDKRALVVDDDPLNQMIITRYLNKLDLKAEVADNGQEALLKFKSREAGYYSLITMDIQMPVMDGLTACREIRYYESQQKRQNKVPIVLVTGNCIDVDANKGLDPDGSIKASYFFRKPFTFEDCSSCVKAILSNGKKENSPEFSGIRLNKKRHQTLSYDM